MAIIETIYNDSALYHALQQTDGYKNNFSYHGANALQAYLDEMSEDIGENIEFDPIAWCCEFSEYADMETFWNDTGYDKNEYATVEELQNHTTVIEFEGGLIVQDF